MKKATKVFRTIFRTVVPVDYIGGIDVEVLSERRRVYFDRTHKAVLIQKFDHAVLHHNNFSIHEQAVKDMCRSRESEYAWNLPAGLAKQTTRPRLPHGMFPLPRLAQQ